MAHSGVIGESSLSEIMCASPDREDETALLARARQGEPEAIDQLYRRHRREVYTLCLNLCDNREEAQDLLQETFLRAVRGLAGFGGRCQVKTWLFRIAVNAARDLARRHRRRPEAPLLEQPAEAVCDSGMIDLVRATLGCLEEDHRVLLSLRYAQSLSYQEIGNCLGWSQSRVKKGVFHARQAFKQAYLEANRC